jgi:ADP-heptose:LPS heptosyltransferase
VPETRKLILVNHLSPGDVLAMTAAVASLHRANPGQFRLAVDSTAPGIWENNPDVVPLEEARAEGFEVVQTHYPAVDACNSRGIHFMQAYCEFLADNLRVPCPLAVNRPQVYLSAQERSWLPQVQEVTGRPTRYWVLNAGVKQDYTAKQYPFYQEVVGLLLGRVLFVQVGQADHLHRPLRGALDLIGKTDDRQLVRLVHHAEGVLGPTSYLMHLAAALEKPAVVLAGGREPRQWNTYPRQVLFSSVGGLWAPEQGCCRQGGCWVSRVVPAGDGDAKDGSLCVLPVLTDPPAGTCMARITPEAVAEAVLSFLA